MPAARIVVAVLKRPASGNLQRTKPLSFNRLRRNVCFSLILSSNRSRGGYSDAERLCDAVGCLRSLRARWHLMELAGCGAAWLTSQEVIGSTIRMEPAPPQRMLTVIRARRGC